MRAAPATVTSPAAAPQTADGSELHVTIVLRLHGKPGGALRIDLRGQPVGGGGTSAEASAYLVGGYFGTWVPAADAAKVRLTPERLGAGAIVAPPASACVVAEVARVTRYLAAESAGQWGPCVHGLAALADALEPSRGDRRCGSRSSSAGAAHAVIRTGRRTSSSRRCASSSTTSRATPTTARLRRRRPEGAARLVKASKLVLKVDPIACDGFGLCSELLPERVDLDPWGYPIVDGTPIPKPSPHTHVAPSRSAPAARSGSRASRARAGRRARPRCARSPCAARRSGARGP